MSAQKLQHINVTKHLWGKVLKNVTNAGIESLIHQGIRHGTWTLLADGSIQILWKYGGQIIEITGKVVNKIFQIGSAWVRFCVVYREWSFRLFGRLYFRRRHLA